MEETRKEPIEDVEEVQEEVISERSVTSNSSNSQEMRVHIPEVQDPADANICDGCQ